MAALMPSHRDRAGVDAPPDLQEWIMRYEGYPNIPWAEWDKAVGSTEGGLRSLGPRLRAADIRTTKLPPKQKDPFYNSPEFAHWRAMVLAVEPQQVVLG